MLQLSNEMSTNSSKPTIKTSSQQKLNSKLDLLPRKINKLCNDMNELITPLKLDYYESADCFAILQKDR